MIIRTYTEKQAKSYDVTIGVLVDGATQLSSEANRNILFARIEKMLEGAGVECVVRRKDIGMAVRYRDEMSADVFEHAIKMSPSPDQWQSWRFWAIFCLSVNLVWLPLFFLLPIRSVISTYVFILVNSIFWACLAFVNPYVRTGRWVAKKDSPK